MNQLIIVFLSLTVIYLNINANNVLKVVSTTPDLADIAKVIGKDKVTVISLSKGSQDPHNVEPRPSMVMHVKKADLLIRVGMDLDLWVESLIDASKNRKVMQGNQGYLDASVSIEKLEIPEGAIDASMGDIHIYGNPHYWLSPENGKIISNEITQKLGELMPSNAAFFHNNAEEYQKELDASMAKWKEQLKPFSGAAIVTYHNSWPYFAKCFNLKIIDFVEPKPGIPPTPSHITSLVQKIKSVKAGCILMEPYFNLKTAESIANKAGIKVVVASPSVGGLPGTGSYLELFEKNVSNLAQALRQ